MIRFEDMNFDAQADFLAVNSNGSIRMCKNLGIVGTKGTSMRFADHTGDGNEVHLVGRRRYCHWRWRAWKQDSVCGILQVTRIIISCSMKEVLPRRIATWDTFSTA